MDEKLRALRATIARMRAQYEREADACVQTKFDADEVYEKVIEPFEALDGWLRQGGFLPEGLLR